jgi:OmcA/MtrC family decaheme c-type cytochrome
VALAQEAPLAWDFSGQFQFNIQTASFDPGSRKVTVVFNVSNPMAGGALYDILDRTTPTFTPPGATLRADVGWNTAGWGLTELVNTGSTVAGGGGPLLLPAVRTWMNFTPPAAGGFSTAMPNVVNALAAARRCSDAGSPCPLAANPTLTFWAATTLPPQAVVSARVALEGRAVVETGTAPIKGAYMDVSLDGSNSPRRQIVDFNKCKLCHDGLQHGDTVIPRLGLHGGNRNEEPGLCVVCHNPNQTDAAYRGSGAEESIDFKRLVHGIHAGGFRESPLVIIGFRGAVNDFSGVRFPKELRNCALCHIDNGGVGTFELRNPSKLGSTIVSQSLLTIPGTIDVDPANDLKISPIAAACSACHDSSEVRQHMVRMGASFGQPQTVLEGKELCMSCHGPGGEKDVRRVHEVGVSEHESEEDDASDER